MIEKLKEKLQGYAISVAIKKGGKVLLNVLTSGTAATWLTAQAQPYLVQYGPLLEKFGVHIDTTVFFVAACGAMASAVELGLDAYGVAQQNKKNKEEVK